MPAAPAGPGGPEGAPVPGPTGSPEVPLLAMPPAPAAGSAAPTTLPPGAPPSPPPGATPVHGAPPPPPGATPPRPLTAGGAAFFTTATPPAATDAPAPLPAPPDAPPTPRTAPDDRPPRRWADRVGTWPVSVVAMAVAVAVGVAKVVSTYGRPYFHYGDQAVLGLRVIDATHLVGQLGPYSRFGWSHPGPALFYLLAPWYRVSGGDPRSLIAGSLLINGACLVMAVVVVRRFAGEWPARWSVAVIGTAALALGIDFFQTFWNPDVVAPALLLTMVLAAAALSGSGPAAVWAAVVGSFAVQTDVGTAGVAGVLVVTAAVGWLVQGVARERRRQQRARAQSAQGPPTPRRVGRGPSVVAVRGQADRSASGRSGAWVLGAVGAVLLVLMWAPPVAQQWSGHPGNLAAIWDFFTTTPKASLGTTHTLAQAWSTVANATTGIPFGVLPSVDPMTAASFARETAMVLLALVGVGAVAWGAWRRRWFEAGLGLVTVLGLAVAVDSAMRIVGPVDNYLAYWMALLPVPGLVAVGSLAVHDLTRRSGRAGAHARPGAPAGWRVGLAWVAAVALVVPALLVARAWAPGTLAVGSSGDPEIGQLADYATAHLAADPSRDVHVVIGNADRWPEAAGLVLQLTRQGYHPTVDPVWGFMFTSRRVGTAAGVPQLILTDPAPGTPAAGSATFADGDVPTTITFVPASPGPGAG